MKKLLLMRHAKTESAEIFRSDFVRNLTPNGVSQAVNQGKFLSLLPFEPQIILVSPANRTIQTLEAILPETQWEEAEVQVKDNLYHCNVSNLLKIINTMDDEIGNLMLIGHNFGMLELVQHFSTDYVEKFSTGSIAMFEFGVSRWAEIEPENANQIYLKSPLDD